MNHEKKKFKNHRRKEGESLLQYQSKSVVQRCSVKKVCLKISRNSQKNTCARVPFLVKLLKKRLWHRCFPVNFAKSLRTPFFTEHLRWLLLDGPINNEYNSLTLVYEQEKNVEKPFG